MFRAALLQQSRKTQRLFHAGALRFEQNTDSSHGAVASLGKENNECQYWSLFASVILSRPPRLIDELAKWDLRACALSDIRDDSSGTEYEKLLWRLEGEENVYKPLSNAGKIEPRESTPSLSQRTISNSAEPLSTDMEFDGESFDHEWESATIKYDEGTENLPSDIEGRTKDHIGQKKSDIEKHCSLNRRLSSRLYLLTKRDDGDWCFPGQSSSCAVQENLGYAALENAMKEFGCEIAEQVKPIGHAPCGHYQRDAKANEKTKNPCSKVFFFMYEMHSSRYMLNYSSSTCETAWVASDELDQYIHDEKYVGYLRKMLP